MKSRFSSIIAIGGLASLTLVGCGGSDGSSGGEADGISLIKSGTLTVCTHLSYEPFEFKDEAGKIVGFDVDLMDLVAEDLGVTQEIVDIDFAQITSGAVFAADKCDVGYGATTITDARKEAILFSDSYFNATQALIVKTDSGITDLADLDGKNLGVQTDTTGQLYGEKQKEEQGYGYEVVIFDDLVLQVNGLLANRVDAAINDNGPLLDFAKQNPETAVVKEFDTGEQYGFMAQKDDENGTKLIAKVNEVLKAAQDDGRYDEIYEKWFGAAPAK